MENALKLTRLETENRDLKARVGKHTLVFAGETMCRVMAQIERVAASETRVCIYGETGTGKELVARTLHEKSSRAAGPFVTLNCAAVPAELIESELFGHEKGSFTGAAQRHTGKFEQAHRGARCFLMRLATCLWRCNPNYCASLEEGEVERIGSGKPTAVDVRVVVATHRNIEQLVEAGGFRRDLYHRVVVFPVELPPLRQRREDLPVLVEHFVRQVSAQNGWKPLAHSLRRLSKLCRNTRGPATFASCAMVERLLLLAGGEVGAEDVRLALPVSHKTAATVAGTEGGASGPLAQRVLAFERAQVLAELDRHGRQITQTAKALGLERSHLYKKCQQLGIDLKDLPDKG